MGPHVSGIGINKFPAFASDAKRKRGRNGSGIPHAAATITPMQAKLYRNGLAAAATQDRTDRRIAHVSAKEGSGTCRRFLEAMRLSTPFKPIIG